MSVAYDFAAGVATGLAGGVTSGLLGVSPGGGLVVFSVLLLGAEQHVVQGLSLIAQIPPTGLAGIRQYRAKGFRAPMRWLALLTVGVVVGGLVGAAAAARVSETTLQWTYVGYLVLLDAMLLLRGNRDAKPTTVSEAALSGPPALGLLLVGLAAGLSSGFMGIGGGLATTVGLSAVLHVPQLQAQTVSLVMSLIPTTMPSAWVYWTSGWSASWVAIIGVLVGLLFGADLGARLAHRIGAAALHRALIVFVSAMALYMTYKALI